MKKLTQNQALNITAGGKHYHTVCKKKWGWYVYCYTTYS